jgi:predicted MPP superfamily phosphohydrolase
MERVAGALREAGITVLFNDRFRLARSGARLDVAGFGDLWSDAFEPQAVPVETTTVALSHNPDTAPALARRGVHLVLSGHTHGGQVWIPGIGAPILPVRHREFVAGHYPVGEGQLYVNRGLGWLRRVRLFTRPEVTVLRLRPA